MGVYIMHSFENRYEKGLTIETSMTGPQIKKGALNKQNRVLLCSFEQSTVSSDEIWIFHDNDVSFSV